MESRCAAIFTIGCSCLFAPASQVDAWQSSSAQESRNVPALLATLESGDFSAAGEAFDKLVVLSEQGEAVRSRLLDACIARLDSLPDREYSYPWREPRDRAQRAFIRELGDFFLDQQLLGRTTRSQEERFWGPIIRSELKIRPRVRAGLAIPYRMVDRARRLMPYRAHETAQYYDLTIDGVPAGKLQLPDGRLPPTEAGEHVVRVRRESRFVLDRDTDRVLHQQVKFLQAEFESVEGDDDCCVAALRDPAIEGLLREHVEPVEVVYGEFMGSRILTMEGTRLAAQIKVDSVPVSVAFDVFIKLGNDELKVGSITHRKGGSGFPKVVGVAHRAPFEDCPIEREDHEAVPHIVLADECTVILRSNKDLALSSVDITEYWEGELVYEGVPLRHPEGFQRAVGAVKHPWDIYVEGFVKDYQLDEDQVATARSILRELKERVYRLDVMGGAAATEESIHARLAVLRNVLVENTDQAAILLFQVNELYSILRQVRAGEGEVQRKGPESARAAGAAKEIVQRIDELFQELKRRLEAVPNESQKKRFRKKDG